MQGVLNVSSYDCEFSPKFVFSYSFLQKTDTMIIWGGKLSLKLSLFSGPLGYFQYAEHKHKMTKTQP